MALVTSPQSCNSSKTSITFLRRSWGGVPGDGDRSRRPRQTPGEENVVPIGLEIESSREQGNTVPTGQPLQISRCQQPVRNDVEAEAGDVLVSAIGEYCGIAQANTVTAEIGIENYDDYKVSSGLNHDDDGQYSRLLEIDEKYFVFFGEISVFVEGNWGEDESMGILERSLKTGFMWVGFNARWV